MYSLLRPKEYFSNVKRLLKLFLSSNPISQISPVNRFWRARGPHSPSPLRRPRTTRLEEEEEETKAAQRKWRFCWRTRKLPRTSLLSSVQSSEPLAPTFSLAQHSRSCRTSSPLLIPSCSGKRLKWWRSLLNLICKLLEKEKRSSIPPLFTLTISRRPFCIYYKWRALFACVAFWRCKR